MQHRRALIVIALLTVAACGGPSTAERRACEAAEKLLASNDRPALRQRVDTMIAESKAANNRALEDAARDFKEALDEKDQSAANSAVGRFYDECARLGLPVP